MNYLIYLDAKIMETNTLIIGGTRGIGYEISKVFNSYKLKNYTLSRTKNKKSSHIQFDINNANNHKIKFGKLKSIIFCQRSRSNNPIIDYETMIINPINFINQQRKNLVSGSSIIFIGSNAYKSVYKEQDVFYHASRGAIISLTKFLSYDLGKKNIRVNCIIPSTLIKKENKKFYGIKKNRKKLENLIPNNTMITSNNIANICLFLCSNNSLGINGEIINVDNGLFSISQETIIKDFKG